MTGIQNQEFYIATGCGGNGKSLLNELFLSMLSEYGYVMPSDALQSDIKEGVNPAIANLHKKRFARCSEPSKEKKLKTSNIKQLTGNSILNARGLYSGSTKTHIQATFLMECNTLPFLDELNQAITRRIRAVEFTTTCLSKEEYDELPDKTNYTIKNTNYVEDWWRRDYRQALFNILCNFCFQEPVLQPEKSKRGTRDYMASSDDFFSWFSEFYEQCGDDEFNVIKITDIFADYKQNEIYQNLTKMEKRRLNKTNFIESIKNNNMLKWNIRDRKEYYNGTRLNTISIVGWKIRQEEREYEECVK